MNRGSRRATLGLVAFLALLLLAWSAPPSAEGQQIHGENSSFFGQGVAMVWGVLRGAREDDTQVILRLALAGGVYASVSMDGVDPFTQRRQEILGVQPLGSQLDIRTPRATFADFPRREIHFYMANDQHAQRPSLTVYFMGLPDTTPEFATEVALFAYLTETMTKLTSGKGRTP